MHRLILVTICMVQAFSGSSQATLHGKLMDSKSDVPLDGATIFNQTRQTYKKASFDGDFSIIALEGDSLIVSSVGYRADTLAVSADMLQYGLTLGLLASSLALDTVMVNVRSYAEDSLQRRLDNMDIYEKQTQNITGGNTPSHGFGLTLSPFSYFSKKSREHRKIKKQLRYNEEQAYIDYYFTASYVHRVTGFSGEQLRRFMVIHRPSYSFMRRATPEDLLRYINEAVKKFRKQG